MNDQDSSQIRLFLISCLVAFTGFWIGVLAVHFPSSKNVQLPAEKKQEMPAEAEVGVEQIMMFFGKNSEEDLQNAVNAWLMNNNGAVEITRVLQTQSSTGDSYVYHYVTITIFYKRTK